MKNPSTVIAISAVSLALATGVGVGIASADPSSTPSPGSSASPDATATPTSPADRKAKKADQSARGGNRLVRRALHGEVTLAGPKHRVVVFQRGTVESVSASAITVKSADGFAATYAIASTTKVRSHQAPGKLGDIAKADRVRVVATRNDTTLTAKVVADRTQ